MARSTSRLVRVAGVLQVLVLALASWHPRPARANDFSILDPGRPAAHLHKELDGELASLLRDAFERALRRVADRPECAQLFESLALDGQQALCGTLYIAAPPGLEKGRCARSFAITHVGAPVTWVCANIRRESAARVAGVLIHEALHHAGLTEQPADPAAMTSAQITKLVRARCGY
jgi:Lon protease-like protein